MVYFFQIISGEIYEKVFDTANLSFEPFILCREAKRWVEVLFQRNRSVKGVPYRTVRARGLHDVLSGNGGLVQFGRYNLTM